MSVEDAKAQASSMNVDYREVNIFPMVSSFNMQLAPLFTGLQADRYR
jgi:NAD+ synthase (glutamine-hydrolysing)